MHNPNPIKRDLGKDFCLICQTKKSENPEHVMHLGKKKVGFFFRLELGKATKQPLPSCTRMLAQARRQNAMEEKMK